MEPKKKVILFIVLFIGMSMVAIGLVLLTRVFDDNSPSPETSGDINQNSYIDPSTGEEVLSPNGKAPEEASGYSGVVILGLSRLLDIGISSNQVDLIKSDLDLFSKNNKVNSNTITEVSLVSDSLKQIINSSTGFKKITGKISVNREKAVYNIEFLYYGISDMETSVYDLKTNSLLYRSEIGD